MQIVNRLYPFRDLFIVFIWREFTIRYRHSIIGIVWAVIQPLSMIALLTFIFSYVLNVKVKEYRRVVFYFAGVLPWTFFSSSLNQSITSLSSQYTLIKKIYFPREIISLSRIVVAFADYLIAALLFAVGDEPFKEKCIEKIREMRNRKTIVLVSHNRRQMEEAVDRIIFLKAGEVIEETRRQYL